MQHDALRIAFAMINCNRRDGSARAVNEVAERLVDRGHVVDLYARKAEDIDLTKVNWLPVPGPSWPEVADFWSFHQKTNSNLPDIRRLASSKRYDIIHSIGCNTLRANVVTIQNIQPAKKIVLDRLGRTENISFPRRLTRWLYLMATCRAEKQLYTSSLNKPPLMFLPVSRGVASELRRHYDIGESLVRIVPNAADIERFKPLSEGERCQWRHMNGVPTKSIMLLFAGGEWARKGLDFAIRALELLENKNTILYVAGDDPDRASYHRLAQDCGCADRVIFGGFRSDMEKVMGAADLFLFPSWYEAFSLATIEAAACGLPIVATKINGTEDFIQPGLTGEFIDHNAEQIATVLNGLCAADTLKIIGMNARRLVEANYTWDRVTTMTENAYCLHLGRR